MSILTNTYLKNDANLVFYAPLNENSGTAITDGSTKANNGTFGGTLGSQWTTGVFNLPAVSFNGTDNVIDMGTPSNLGLTGNCSFTLAAWVNMSSLNTDGAIIAYGNGGSAGTVIAMAQNTDYSMRSIHWSNDHIYTTLYDRGIWTHCAITYDGTTEKLYKNGIYTGESWAPTALNMVAGHAFKIGKTTWEAVFLGQCKVQEVAAFSRALTAQEVALLGSPAEVGAYNMLRSIRVGDGMSRNEGAS